MIYWQFYLVASVASTETNCSTLERADEICFSWAWKHGAAFAPKKYELIILTRRPKKFNMAIKVDLSSHQIQLKVLESLDWWQAPMGGPHIKESQAKSVPQAMAPTKIAASTWGGTAPQVYPAVGSPTMIYGASVLTFAAREKKAKG